MSTKSTLYALPLMTALAFAAPRIASLPMVSEGGFTDIVEKTLPSVVRVVTSSLAAPRGKAWPGGGEGSGVVVSHDGYLLTKPSRGGRRRQDHGPIER